MIVRNVTQGFSLEWFLSYKHFLVGTWTECGKPAALSRGSSFHFTGRIWLRMKCPKCPNVLNPLPSLCHTTAQCHKSHSIAHHKLLWESVLHTSLFLSGFWQTSPARPLQSAWATARRVRPISYGTEQGWQLILSQLPCLRRVAERDSPFPARLYLFFMLLYFKQAKKKSLLEK